MAEVRASVMAGLAISATVEISFYPESSFFQPSHKHRATLATPWIKEVLKCHSSHSKQTQQSDGKTNGSAEMTAHDIDKPGSTARDRSTLPDIDNHDQLI